jgi:hypothetical protein
MKEDTVTKDDANVTDTPNWLVQASLHGQMAYVLACAAADRFSSWQFWSGKDTGETEPRNVALALDARASYEHIRKLQDDYQRGVFAVVIPQTIVCPECDEKFYYDPTERG